MWTDTRITRLFGIDHPIIQAPMVGSSTPELAAAVSSAGGLGSLGCGLMDLTAIRDMCARMRDLTDAPYNLNFFVPEDLEPLSDAEYRALKGRLEAHYVALGLGQVPGNPQRFKYGFDEESLDLLLEIRPAVASFHFGLPASDAIEAIRSAGIKVIATATNLSEAMALEKAGVDAIIAQGFEAGGHRGSHAPQPPGDGVGLMSLVPAIADSIDLPVIAAGGISDGRGIAAAMLLGASAVQLGTAFLPCPESSVAARHRELVAAARPEQTMFIDAVSGRVARGWRSNYAEDIAAAEARPAPFPTMYSLARPLLEASAEARPEHASFFLMGQSAGRSRAMPAAELFDLLVKETKVAIQGLTA